MQAHEAAHPRIHERENHQLPRFDELPSRGVEPARFVNDRPIPAKGEHPAPDPYLYTLRLAST